MKHAPTSHGEGIQSQPFGGYTNTQQLLWYFVHGMHSTKSAKLLVNCCLPLEFKPVYSVGDLLTQHLEELEQEAERKGGVLQTLLDHFAKIYRAPLSAPLAAEQDTT
jgi:hypothetical protein